MKPNGWTTPIVKDLTSAPALDVDELEPVVNSNKLVVWLRCPGIAGRLCQREQSRERGSKTVDPGGSRTMLCERREQILRSFWGLYLCAVEG